MAIALDTVAAVVATPSVTRVVVVTSAAAAPAFNLPGVQVVLELPVPPTEPGDPVGEAPGGHDRLNAAIRLGLETVQTVADSAVDSAVAVLLGDVPALRPEELELALREASDYPLAMVADADGVGTVLITAMPGIAHSPAFGGASRQRHLDAGYRELAVDVDSGLRRDIDTLEQLSAVIPTGVGPRTTSAY
ncbi:MAG: cofC [Glaciihabitans sp.]|nr:cofC [Glaciihabitans sp.]